MSEVLIREKKFLHEIDALLQVGYAEKMANVWAKAAEETSSKQ